MLINNFHMNFKRIGFLEAMKEELDSLLKQFPSSQIKVEKRDFIDFYLINFKNLELIVCLCGVGKVNSGITTALMITHYNPDAIINVGVAGGFRNDQHIFDLFIAESFVYTDVDIMNMGLKPGQILFDPQQFPASHELVNVVKQLEHDKKIDTNVHYGLLGSSDSFIRTKEQVTKIQKLYNNEVGCVEMEGASIAHACYKFGKPVLSIRSLSDIAVSEEDNTNDFTTFLEKATFVSTKLCMSILSILSC